MRIAIITASLILSSTVILGQTAAKPVVEPQLTNVQALAEKQIVQEMNQLNDDLQAFELDVKTTYPGYHYDFAINKVMKDAEPIKPVKPAPESKK